MGLKPGETHDSRDCPTWVLKFTLDTGGISDLSFRRSRRPIMNKVYILVVIDESDSVNRSLLHDRIVEDLSEVEIGSLVASLFEVIMQRRVEERELGAQSREVGV